MDKSTQAISNIIAQKGIKLSHLSKKTGIPYYILFQSLSPKNGRRSLRADELISICKELELNPFKITHINDV